MQASGQIYMVSIDDVNYIGQALGSSLSRWSTHLKLLNSNKHHCKILQNKFNEFGIEAMSFKILKTKVNQEYLNNEENLFTKKFNGVNAYAGNYSKIEKKKLIANDILAKIPYREIAQKHNVSLGLVAKVKSVYL